MHRAAVTNRVFRRAICKTLHRDNTTWWSAGCPWRGFRAHRMFAEVIHAHGVCHAIARRSQKTDKLNELVCEARIESLDAPRAITITLHGDLLADSLMFAARAICAGVITNKRPSVTDPGSTHTAVAPVLSTRTCFMWSEHPPLMRIPPQATSAAADVRVVRAPASPAMTTRAPPPSH